MSNIGNMAYMQFGLFYGAVGIVKGVPTISADFQTSIVVSQYTAWTVSADHNGIVGGLDTGVGFATPTGTPLGAFSAHYSGVSGQTTVATGAGPFADLFEVGVMTMYQGDTLSDYLDFLANAAGSLGALPVGPIRLDQNGPWRQPVPNETYGPLQPGQYRLPANTEVSPGYD